jgi:hypothetical protein
MHWEDRVKACESDLRTKRLSRSSGWKISLSASAVMRLGSSYSGLPTLQTSLEPFHADKASSGHHHSGIVISVDQAQFASTLRHLLPRQAPASSVMRTLERQANRPLLVLSLLL